MSNLFEKMMSGDIDGIQREMEETKFKRQAEFAATFRDTICKNGRPDMAYWLEKGGWHEPSCGYLVKGDLVRWVNTADMDNEFSASLDLRLPTIRKDMIQDAIDGKIMIKGTELLYWLVAKLDERTLRALMLIRRNNEKVAK